MADQQNSAIQWSQPLRLIHLLLAAAVTAQLFIGSFMRSPHPGRPDSFGFETHEVLGATILTLIIVHWIWSFTHSNEGLGRLFPWTRAGIRSVLKEFWTGVRYLRLPSGETASSYGLAGFVHGLGLLAVTAVAAIGASFYLSRLSGVPHSSLNLIEDIHDTFAVIVWIYWGGHLVVTVLHSLLHQPVWKRMFGFGR